MSNLIDLAETIDWNNDSSLGIDINNWSGLLTVDILAMTNDLFGVIGSTLHLSS